MAGWYGLGWQVSVAGCLGYDVLALKLIVSFENFTVSVAGCLGYDVLESKTTSPTLQSCFSCWLFRL